MSASFPLDFAAFRRHWRPNDCLAVPEGAQTRSRPDLTAPVFAAGPKVLADAVRAVALAEPRTELLREDVAAGQMEFRQRSEGFGFPDTITVRVEPVGEGRSTLSMWSRAKYGIGDRGVNRRRVKRWLAALTERLGGSE